MRGRAPARTREFPASPSYRQCSFILVELWGPHHFSMKGLSPSHPRALTARKRRTQPFAISSLLQRVEAGRAWKASRPAHVFCRWGNRGCRREAASPGLQGEVVGEGTRAPCPDS